MFNKDEYIKAIKRVGYGYLLTLINIHIGNVNIIASWMGYIFFYKAINVLSKYEKSTALLKPLNIILGIYELIVWVLQIFGRSINNYVIFVVVIAISLYFHFQLLTDIATLAKKHHSLHANRIIQLRNADMIFTTLLALPIPWIQNIEIAIAFLVLALILSCWICRIMFVYANEEKNLIYDVSED